MKPRSVESTGPLRGQVKVPGDKSISHRALLLNGLATGPSTIRNLLHSEDIEATTRALQRFGVAIEFLDGEVRVRPSPLQEPTETIDCGNSGTSIRLLAGVAARFPIFTVFTGDASLQKRPMARVLEPLRAMGAQVDGRGNGRFAPITVRGGELHTVDHQLPVASAQVKSALLLAGLDCGVAVKEPAQSRDHTERMLRAMGANLSEDPQRGLVLKPVSKLEPLDIEVPGDLSAAAFFLVGAAITAGSDLILPGVGINPTRSGIIDALIAMGADLTVESERNGIEPIANLRIRASSLRGIRIDGELALRCLDEIPILAIAAAFATGETVIADAAELRVKESDRLARMAAGLRHIGIDVEERPDGMIISGGRPNRAAEIDATGDHRIAMAFSMAAVAGDHPIAIYGDEAIGSSYPKFFADLEAVRA